jgi:hypothetical protein
MQPAVDGGELGWRRGLSVGMANRLNPSTDEDGASLGIDVQYLGRVVGSLTCPSTALQRSCNGLARAREQP